MANLFVQFTNACLQFTCQVRPLLFSLDLFGALSFKGYVLTCKGVMRKEQLSELSETKSAFPILEDVLHLKIGSYFFRCQSTALGNIAT